MGNELHETDENTGTMEVLDRHQFDVSKLQDFMYENIEGFEGNIQFYLKESTFRPPPHPIQCWNPCRIFDKVMKFCYISI